MQLKPDMSSGDGDEKRRGEGEGTEKTKGGKKSAGAFGRKTEY